MCPFRPFDTELLVRPYLQALLGDAGVYMQVKLFTLLRPLQRNTALRVNVAWRDAVRAGVARGIFRMPGIDYHTAVLFDYFGSAGTEEVRVQSCLPVLCDHQGACSRARSSAHVVWQC